MTGISPAFAMTFNDKLNFLAGTDWYYSAVGDPTTFNDPNAEGDGFIQLGNQSGTPENLLAMAPFQGNVALFSRRTVQFWAVDPNPNNYAKQQVLQNIGTVSGKSVNAVGDMDVYFLADSGVRSLRPRVASNNAFVADVGSPIDLILQPILAALTDAEKAASCAIMEPTQNRYMIFIPDSTNSNGVGLIYVFSSFPSSQIEAWSTYEPSYQLAITNPAANYTASQVTYTGLVVGKRYAWTPGADEVSLTNGAQVFSASVTQRDGTVLSQIPTSFIATATTAVVVGTGATVAFTGALTLTTYFTPQDFCVYGGQVWVRDTANNVYLLGGSNNVTYENCGMSGMTPYYDEGTAGTIKSFEAIDTAFQGTWTLGFSSDYITQKFKTVYQNNVSSFQYGRISVKMRGTHYAVNFTENSNGYALFSSFLVHTQIQEEK